MPTLTLLSWNVNGLRAQEKKGFRQWLLSTGADVIAIQETKSHPEQLTHNLLEIPGYQSYWKSGERKGYSGVAIYSRIPPLQVIDNFPAPILNAEGRLLGLEFEKFFFFTGYFPNGGQGPHRVEYKLNFYHEFEKYIESLPKPVIFCGDVNTAHNEIDLAHPRENRLTSGFLDIERAWLNHIFHQKGYIDTFRKFHPEPNRYSWWDMKTYARSRNIGWRLDYFITSPALADKIKDANIHDEIMGSDHAPVSLKIEI